MFLAEGFTDRKFSSGDHKQKDHIILLLNYLTETDYLNKYNCTWLIIEILYVIKT